MATRNEEIDQAPRSPLALAEAIDATWDAEGCRWSMRWDGAVGEWCVTLEWWTDRDVPHQADFCRLTWEFWAGTPGGAQRIALAWLDDLAQFGSPQGKEADRG